MDHSVRAHALLGASSAKRWLACPPSARATDKKADTSSGYALEGTVGHELSEAILRLYLDVISKKEYKQVMGKLMKSEYYCTEMELEIEKYTGYIIEQVESMKENGTTFVEQRVDYSEYVPEGFGTCDFGIISGDTIHIIDLKYGKGIRVDAHDNPQMKLYALGFYELARFIYDIKYVKMTIAQVRLDHIVSETVPIEDLISWGESIKPRALLAHKGLGEFKAGEHCRFCKLKSTCRARAEENLKLAQYEFKAPQELDKDEIADILTRAKEFSKWISDVTSNALQSAKDGTRYPGFKLVAGRSSRKYKSSKEVLEALLSLGYEKDRITSEPKLLGITAITKAIGKKQFKEELEAKGLIVKPTGAATLVPESDKREELNSLAQAQSEFMEV